MAIRRDAQPTNKPRFSSGRRLLIALAVFALWLAIPTFAAATPAHFTYELCDSALPGGNPPALSFHASSTAYGSLQNCSTPGGGVGVLQSGQVTASPAWVELGILPTPGGFVESETITAFATGLQPGQEASHVFAEGWPLNGVGDTTRLFHIASARAIFGGNGGGFNVVLTCSTTCNTNGYIAAHYIAVTEVDLVPPAVSRVEGQLLGGGVLRGHQALSAVASDEGGGLSHLEVLVNGIPAPGAVAGNCAVAQVRNPSYEGTVAVSTTPCPTTLTGTWSLDTAAYPFQDGANTVSVCASDFATAGTPNTTCSPPKTISVNNSCTESPVSGGQVLSAQFAHSSTEAVTVPFGHGAEVAGTLADQAGEPVSGATICVEARRQGEPGEPRPVAVATTGTNGEFTYEAPPGPNRQLLIGYRHDAFQIGRTLTVGTHARPTLKLSASRVNSGDRIKISGKLPGPDAAGRVLVEQASSLHGRWLTFRRVTTGPRGGYKTSYRFGDTTHTITYRIRTVAPEQSGYSYEAGASSPKRVKVRG